MHLHRAPFRRGALAFCLTLLLSHAPVSTGGEAVFGYVYTTDLMPKGKSELEQWITDRRGQAYSRFDDFNLRTEYEYGITDNLQVSGYLNYSYQWAHGNSVRHATEGLDCPGTTMPVRVITAPASMASRRNWCGACSVLSRIRSGWRSIWNPKWVRANGAWSSAASCRKTCWTIASCWRAT